MKWSWKLATVAGIDIYIHATFVLIIGWVALSHWLEDQTISTTLAGILFTLALFACVVLHELGHALTAKRYGIKTRDITLLPIGGVARLERMPDDPGQEFWVALAGPAVNVVIAAVLYVILLVTGGMESLERLSVTGGSFAQRLMLVNISLVLFNLLPAFPMDGGRVVRALLAMRMDYSRATQIAATLGQGMALIFGFLGLLGNPVLLFIALFVWIGASQEASMVQMKSALSGIPVGRAMLTNYRTLSPADTLAHAIELTLTGSQQDFPVVENGQPVGVLTRGDLLGAISERGREARVGDIMQRQFQVADSFDMLERVLAQCQGMDCRTMPVVHNGRLVGLLTMENVGEFLMFQTALAGVKQS